MICTRDKYLRIVGITLLLLGGVLRTGSAVQDPFNQPLKKFEKSETLPQKERLRLKTPSHKRPPLPERAAAGTFFLKKVRVEGVTAFSPEEISKITAPYENRRISFGKLQELRQKLTLLYINGGFVNSGVFIPDQKVTGNSVVFRVIEGRVSDAKVSGNRYFRSSYLKKRLALGMAPPLNTLRLAESLRILQGDHRIKKIVAELSPGTAPGEAELSVKVDENHPYRLSVTVANEQSPSIGSYRAQVRAAHENLTGNGDIAEARYGRSEGAEDYQASYLLPLTRYDTKGSLFYQHVESTVLERSFEKLDIESKTESFGFLFSHPFVKRGGREFTLSLKGELRKNETFLLGRPFSFTGSRENKTNISVLRLLQEWVSRNEHRVYAVHSQVSLGLKAFGATLNDTGADGSFFSWTARGLWLRKFFKTGIQTLLKGRLQWSDVSLLPMEKFSIGGMNTVRGFRENRIVRDKGISGSFEVRVPLIKNRRENPLLSLASFYDIGWAWNSNHPTPEPGNLSAIGLGLRGELKTLSFALYWGHALRTLKQAEYDLQDDGIHFNLSWNIF